jgi:hypothetical protein
MRFRPYQLEIARAVVASVLEKRGLTITVEMARQGGKNETSARLGVLLLTAHMERGGAMVKCSPTFKPQTIISMSRLKERLDDFGFRGLYQSESGYIVRLGAARQVFLSAEEQSNVVGHTADILLEVDEAQDVTEDKYTREFRPMGSAGNVTTVMWGTTWDDSTLLERTKQANLELERKDGVRRHFSFDWQAVAQSNDAYRVYVEAERERLGENHPLFLTQYALKPISGGGRFLSAQQVAQLMGDHPRRHQRYDGRAIVAGIDIAGEAEYPEALSHGGRGCGFTMPEASSNPPSPGGSGYPSVRMGAGEGELSRARYSRDATVVTIAALTPDLKRGGRPLVRVLEHYAWVGVRHAELHNRLVDLLGNVWRCNRIAVDATGIGEPVASFLSAALGNSRVVPFKFTPASKSQLGFDLLAAVNAGRLKLYQPDGSGESRELMAELALARSACRANQTLNFFVDPSEGHDDYLMSLALCLHAADGYVPRVAVAGVLGAAGQVPQGRLL